MKRLIGLFAALMVVGAAHAQTPPEPDHGWTVFGVQTDIYLDFSGGLATQQSADIGPFTGLFGTPITSDFTGGPFASVGVGAQWELHPKVNLLTEVEFSYRHASMDGVSIPITIGTVADFESYNLMFNVVVDITLYGTGHDGFGIYAGGGAGLTYTTLDMTSPIPITGSDDEFGFQALAGLRYRFNRNWLMYSGVRYQDGGDPGFAAFGVPFTIENNSWVWELGLSYTF